MRGVEVIRDVEVLEDLSQVVNQNLGSGEALKRVLRCSRGERFLRLLKFRLEVLRVLRVLRVSKPERLLRLLEFRLEVLRVLRPLERLSGV